MSFATYDDWRCEAPPCDGPEPCSVCDGRGEHPKAVRHWFDDKRGFDAEDILVECLSCDGSGVR